MKKRRTQHTENEREAHTQRKQAHHKQHQTAVKEHRSTSLAGSPECVYDRSIAIVWRKKEKRPVSWRNYAAPRRDSCSGGRQGICSDSPGTTVVGVVAKPKVQQTNLHWKTRTRRPWSKRNTCKLWCGALYCAYCVSQSLRSK